ncbi:hypothetical protein MKW92_027742, partial [Papaver armeniacum]
MDLNKREEEEVDWISSLPDSLVHHILSFLDIKRVAQTSVLSKRWSYIWTTFPILDFYEPVVGYDPTDSKTNKFIDFVDGTLRCRQANIERFRICWSKHLNEDRVNSWITSAVSHRVQQVSLNLTQDEPLTVTQSLFTCESLISLELHMYCNVCFPNYISLPKLKRLVLEGVEFSDENWNENHFPNSPGLEEIIIEHCSWLDMSYFCISASTLKLFYIANWDDKWLPRGEDDGLGDCTLKVDAPNLETFHYNGSIAKEYVMTTFSSLVKADVEFRFKPYVATKEQRIVHGAAISQFLRAIANVEILSVSDDTLQALSFADDLLENLPTFHNAEKLTMLEEVTDDKALVALLKATPNLESLVFEKDPPDISDDEEEDDVAGSDAEAAEGEDNHGTEDDDWTLDMVTDPECLFTYLQSVEFTEFMGNPLEMRWVKLILKNAKALQTMSISNCDHSLNTKRKEELMVEIPSLSRASTSCVFEFPDWQ